jgi:hypothetical protein
MSICGSSLRLRIRSSDFCLSYFVGDAKVQNQMMIREKTISGANFGADTDKDVEHSSDFLNFRV